MPDQSKPAEGGTTSALPVSAGQIEHAAALLDAGGLVAFPTETVYGLGG
ncbi:MAG TPA: translation factor Sua5, partial [Paraburkholderia sp.]